MKTFDIEINDYYFLNILIASSLNDSSTIDEIIWDQNTVNGSIGINKKCFART